MGFEIGFGGAFVAGIVSFLSPCVLPLVPPYLTFLAGVSLEELTSETENRPTTRVMLSALAFVLGFATVFTLLGAGASAIGRIMQQNFDVLAMVGGGIIILFGLHFLGAFRVALFYREARVHLERKPPGFLGAYVIGLAFAFGWTPCVGPVLASILFLAAGEETIFHGMFLLLCYALGIGVPFLLAAAFAHPFMGFMARFRKHLEMVEKCMGAMLVVTGILLMTGTMSEISYLLLEYFPAMGTLG
ncbi:MAG: cytochrome c biogenesis CcdA family protein [Alphaproteobacteria bacterium]